MNEKRLKIVFHIISLIILLVCLALAFTLFFSNFKRIWVSLGFFWENVGHYLSYVFGFESNAKGGIPLNEVIEYRGGIESVLPLNVDSLVIELKSFFKLFFNGTFQKINLLNFLRNTSNLFRALVLLSFFIPFIYFFSKLYFSTQDEENINVDSKPLTIYKLIKEKIILRIYRYIYSFILFFKDHKYYSIPFLVLISFYINLISIVIDLISWYFYFVAVFDFKSILDIILLISFDLSPLLLRIPLFIYLLLAYIIFDRIRINAAYDTLEHFENYDKGFVSSLGIYTMINGAPGSGKTLVMTDLSLSAEQVIRYNLLKIQNEISLELPHFPFLNLEKEIDKAVAYNEVNNHFQVKEWLLKKVDVFYESPTKENLFGYDFENELMYVNDNLHIKTIKEELSDYAQAYYLYSINSALAVSNYAIRFDGAMCSNGFLKRYCYDTFHEDPFNIDDSNTSKILDFNSLRILKRMDDSKKNNFVLEVGVAAMTEIGKERKNQFSLNSMKKDDLKANQRNDGYNECLKLKRHDTTIRNKCFYYNFVDDQRSESLNADNRDLCEYIIYLPKEQGEWKNCLAMWWIEPMISDAIVSFRNKLYERFYMVRGDNTLFMYLINSIGSFFYKYKLKRCNTFNYKKIDFRISDKLDEYTHSYYLCTKKIFSKRYSTDCYRSFFEFNYLKESTGFKDLPNYSSYEPTLDELYYQNSYFITELKESFTKVNYVEEDNNDLNY